MDKTVLTPSLVVIPYLKTSDKYQYKDLVIRSIKDIEGLSAQELAHIKIITKMFFLRDDSRIQFMSYLIINDERDDSNESLFQQLIEFQTIAAYLYSSPHRTFGDTFLSTEHASIFAFTPMALSNSLIRSKHNVVNEGQDGYPDPDDMGHIEGYQVLLNLKRHNWVTRGSRIYPPVGRLWLNASQDISADFNPRNNRSDNLRIIDFFSANLANKKLKDRILTSLIWYNRSNTLDIDQDLALVNLAVAFESLLGLEQKPRITDRFKEAVILLLGGFPRLESWLTQFYDARSQIVHKGQTADLSYRAVDYPSRKGKSELVRYRSLVSYGRLVFRACLNTIISGALISGEIGLPSMLYTNQQRYEKICQILDEEEDDPKTKLLEASEFVNDIDEYKFLGEEGLMVKTLLGASSRLARIYLETDPTDNPELNRLLDDFVGTDMGQDDYESLDGIRKIDVYLQGGFLRNRLPGSKLDTVCLLIESVWHYTFMHYYWLKEAREEENG